MPAVLVPWSGASEDHQVANVRWLSDSGGAVLVPDNDVEGWSLRRHYFTMNNNDRSRISGKRDRRGPPQWSNFPADPQCHQVIGGEGALSTGLGVVA